MADFPTGTVVLINFPFTNGATTKKRPALVLLDLADQDLLLARITTQPWGTSFDCPLENWSAAGLKAPSFVRLHKLATLEKTLIEKRLGLLTPADMQRVLQTWNGLGRRISHP